MKKLPKLSKRLSAIANLVPENSKVADIGTDHAYIPVYLTNKGISNFAIASDVKKGPLFRAKSTIAEFEAAERVETRLGSGLESIKCGEVDTVIIAGMGGILISNILDNSKDVLDGVTTLILQPMTAIYELRKYLNENGYIITNETLISEDNKLYTVIKAEKGTEIIENDIYFNIGKKLIENCDPLIMALIEKHISKLTKQINGLLSAEQTEERTLKLSELKEMLNEIQTLKSKLQEAEKND